MGEDPLVDFDMVEHRAETPVLDQRVSGHLAVVDHACRKQQQRTRRPDHVCTVHSLLLNPGLLWQRGSLTIPETSGTIKAYGVR